MTMAHQHLESWDNVPHYKRQEEYHDDQPEGYQFYTNTDNPGKYRRKLGFKVTKGAFWADGTPWPSAWTVWRIAKSKSGETAKDAK